MKLLMTFLIIFLLSPAFLRAASMIEPTAHFYEGNQAYKSGDYKKSIEEYESIIKDGFESGNVYYNLGNSYIKNGQLGKGIVNYERARKLLPRDSDLKANYAYAISSIKNYSSTSESTISLALMNAYRDYLTVDEITIILLCLGLLMGAFYLMFIWMGWSRKIMMGSILMLVLCFVFHGIVFSLKISLENRESVVLREAQVKFEPADGATTYFRLPEGEKVKLLEDQSGWIKIERSDGRMGWVKDDLLEKI